MRWAIAALTLLGQVLTPGVALAKNEFNYPGGVAEFLIEKKSSDMPVVKFGLREPVIIEQSSHWRVLVGLSLDLLPGEYVSYIKRSDENTSGTHKRIFVRRI